jgi:uncharacterized protein YndB with AHSA1/START domain
MDRGSYIRHDGRPAVRFERTYARSVERTWEAVATPEGLAHWFPSKVELEARAGGTISFSGDPFLEPFSGRILVFEPPRRLAFTWGDDELHFDLEPVGAGHCRFTLVQVLAETDTAARTAAGWAVCVAELGKHLSGGQVDGPHGKTAESWKVHYDYYVAAGMPSGAFIPGADPEANR